MEIEKFCLPDRFISFLSNRRDGNSLENYFSIFRSFEQYDLTTMLLNNAEPGPSDPGGRLGHGPSRFVSDQRGGGGQIMPTTLQLNK